MDIPKLTKSVNLQPLFMAAAVLYTITALTGEDTGIREAVSVLLGPILEGRSAMVIVVILVVLTGILTEFMNNSVVASLFIATGALLVETVPGLSAGALVLAIPMAAYASVAMPSANAGCAIVFSQTDIVTPASMMKQGWATVAFVLVLLCLELPYITWVMG